MRPTANNDTALRSCLYLGQVMHKRLRPFVHRFTYRVVSFLVDLDELPALDRRLPLFAHNRFGLFSFHDRDHGPRDGSPLRPWIERQLAEAGIDIAGGPVRILCFPRLWGYVFNPLSVWFCSHPEQGLRAILYEVSNTFGETHGYLIPVAPGTEPGAPIHQACDKGFYVSPFIEMRSHYRFRLREPDERLSLLIRQRVPEGEILLASLNGRRRALSGGTLARAALAHPLMTLKVIVAIHWEALHLWRKGARFRRRPAAPSRPVTQVQHITLEAAE